MNTLHALLGPEAKMSVLLRTACLAVSPVEATAICPVTPARTRVVLGQALVNPIPDEPSLQTSVLAKNLSCWDEDEVRACEGCVCVTLCDVEKLITGALEAVERDEC